MNVSRETAGKGEARDLVAAEFDVSRETMARLDRFAALFLKWNARINLVARADQPRLWDRHIADSLQLVPFLPDEGAVADLGSGGGFPGLIIAIATGREITLIEADARKAAFLREAGRETGAAAKILNGRIEAQAAIRADVVTARALAPLRRLLELSVPLLAPGGFCLFLKGASVAEELTECRGTWEMNVERHPSRIDPQGCVLRLSEVSRV